MRNRLYRHVVQRPMTPGLQWSSASSRMNRAPPCRSACSRNAAAGRRRPGPRAWVSTSPRRTGRDSQARGDRPRGRQPREKEGCATPALAAGPGEGREKPDAADDHRGHPTEYGLAHFSRDRGGNTKEEGPGCAAKAPTGIRRGSATRYASFYKQKRREAMAVATMLRRFPRCLGLLRGIDICTDEVGSPPGMAPSAHVREVSQRASAHLQSKREDRRPCGDGPRGEDLSIAGAAQDRRGHEM